MILKSTTTAAFKCNICGNKQGTDIDLFNFFMGEKSHVLVCEYCRGACAVIERISKGNYKITVPCGDCFEDHCYTVSAVKFWQSKLTKLKCPITGNVVFVCGNPDDAYDILDSEFTAPENMFENIQPGDEDLEAFENLEELMRLVDHLRELDKKRKIMCPCGSLNISMQFDDIAIRFTCEQCGRENILDVSSREQMRAVMGIDEIELV